MAAFSIVIVKVINLDYLEIKYGAFSFSSEVKDKLNKRTLSFFDNLPR